MMWYFFFGFLFVFVEFPLDVPMTGGSIDILPSFLGFALLFLGAQGMRTENEHFRRIRIFSLITLAVSAAQFCFAFLGYKIVELVLFILATAANLYITYEFTEGVKKIERSRYKKLGADKLSSAWIILCMTSLLGFLVPFVPTVALPQLALDLLAVIWFESSLFKLARALRSR